jgi:NADH:ubiquinone oxidoreductase subunit 4 (subunit M)
MYTLLGSVFLFLVMFALYFEIGSTSFFSLYEWTNRQSFFVPGLFVVNYIAFLLFLVFAIKIPVFPFHI